MRSYTLELRKMISVGYEVENTFELVSDGNLTALLDGQSKIDPIMKSQGFELIDCGMYIGDDVTSRDLYFIKDGIEHYYTLEIIKEGK